MKTFESQAAQGDVLIRKIDKLPKDATPIEQKSGEIVVAHSETGHHHAINAQPSIVQLFGSKTPNLAYLKVERGGSVDLVHHRPWDTHETLRIAEGVYEVRRQREATPTGWATVQD